MRFLIDNKPAVIAKDTKIDYVSSNLLFADREDFSLAFDLPLRGCKENREIFADVYRKDIDIDTLYYDAEIYAGKFHVSGAITIVEVNDVNIKVQFLSGRSFKNFYVDWDNLFINELNLGSYTYATNRTPASMWGANDVVALPWVNNTSGNLQNRADNVNGVWQWHTTQDDDDDTEVVSGLSCQLRLYTLVQKICDALQYDFIGDAWANDAEYYKLYMLNTLPAAWGDAGWATVLPHWSINEFFSELEKLLLGEFDINHKEKTVTFSFSMANEQNAGYVALDNVVDEFSVSVDKDDQSDYGGTANTGYATCSHELWNFYSCYWYFKKHPNERVKTYSTLAALVNHLETSGPDFGRSVNNANDTRLLYCEDVHTYFVLVERIRKPTDARTSLVIYGSGYELRPVNRFGDWITDPDNYNTKEEIRCVPAWLDLAIDIDDNDNDIMRGRVLFLDCGSTDNVSTSGLAHHGTPASVADAQEWQKEINQANLFTTQCLINGEAADKSGRFDKIYVGFWYGEPGVFGDKLPAPWVDQFEIESEWNYIDLGNSRHKIVGDYTVVNSGHDGTLRINNAYYRFAPTRDGMTKIDQYKKYEFSFLAEDMPNVRAHFLIRGKWYLCSELHAEVGAHGLSKVMKGTFWRIIG